MELQDDQVTQQPSRWLVFVGTDSRLACNEATSLVLLESVSRIALLVLQASRHSTERFQTSTSVHLRKVSFGTTVMFVGWNYRETYTRVLLFAENMFDLAGKMLGVLLIY